MKMLADYLRQSADMISRSASAISQSSVEAAIDSCVAAVQSGHPILVCGNGGSASDAAHITGELVGRFLKERQPINAICLSANTSVLTAWGNDYDFETVFSRQVEAHGREGGVLIAISTSGNSKNIVSAAKAARVRKMTVIALTGEGGGALSNSSDILLAVPSSSTPMIQQVHICLYHYLCEHIETRTMAS